VQQNKWKFAVIGALAGSVATFVLAAPSIVPLAWADEQPIRTLQAVKQNTLDLFERDMELFKPQWSTEPSVSQDVQSNQVIRKIEAGRTSFVQVVTTSSGVYSSDALDSPHVRYPGIHREVDHDFDGVAALADGHWVGLGLHDAHSFVAVVPMTGGGFAVISQ